MISRTPITKNLKELNKLFLESRGRLRPQFYSKLAIIETCGWIEECMDEVVRQISNTLNAVNRGIYENETVDKTSGFSYQKYIRNKLLKNLIGIALIEKIEIDLNRNPDFSAMDSALRILTTARNDIAHTHISGTTASLMAPSITINHFETVYKGIKVLEKRLKKIKFR